MARALESPESGKPRGIRFPEPLRLRLAQLAADTQRTFSDMVIHAVLKGLTVLEQEEQDRVAGEHLRKQRERK